MKERGKPTTPAQRITLAALRIICREEDYIISSIKKEKGLHYLAFMAYPPNAMRHFLIVHPVAGGEIEMQFTVADLLHSNIRKKLKEYKKGILVPVHWRKEPLVCHNNDEPWKEYLGEKRPRIRRRPAKTK